MATGIIVIEPVAALAATASAVSEALSVRFALETWGRFEEFPAYVGNWNGLELALLGPPAPEHDVGEDRSQDFVLQVSPVDSQAQLAELHRILVVAGVAASGYEPPPNNSSKPTPLRGAA